jgi:hypothetical protein
LAAATTERYRCRVLPLVHGVLHELRITQAVGFVKLYLRRVADQQASANAAVTVGETTK